MKTTITIGVGRAGVDPSAVMVTVTSGSIIVGVRSRGSSSRPGDGDLSAVLSAVAMASVTSSLSSNNNE
jgi:hypothetical protein